MLKWMAAVVLAVCALTAKGQSASAEPAKAQESKRFFELAFVVREVDAERVVNSRTYTVIASTGNGTSIRAGENVPFANSDGPTTQWQQVHVGFQMDCRNLAMIGDRLALRISGKLDSLAGTQEQKTTRQPVIRDNIWDSEVIVPLRHPTIITSSDDPFSTRKIQLQLTATPLP